MNFELVHAAGTRERWKTTSTLTRASAALLADEVAAIEGVTGVTVNARTGSVVLTVSSAAAKTRTYLYFESLKRVPPVRRRQPRTSADNEALREKARDDARKLLHADAATLVRETLPSTERWIPAEGAEPAATTGALQPARTRIGRFVETLVRGFAQMPILELIDRIKALFAHALPLGRAGARGPQALRAAPAGVPATVADENDASAELDFAPLARYVFLRPMLPMLVNTANAVLGAIPRLVDAAKELMHGRLNVEVLDGAAILISLLRRDFRTVGLLVLLLGLGEMLENYTRKKSLASLADQLAIKVDRVWIRSEGKVRSIPLSELSDDDVVVVRSGSVIPVDGVVLAGDAAVNQATMTGEPLPVHRTTGGSVFAGTVVEDGEIDIRPTARGDRSRLSKIVRFIENSEAAKAGIQGKAERLADAIVPYNLLLAGLVFLVTRDLTRTASVLLVDYSCALRLATPLAILTAMRTGTEKGVLVKGGRFLEALSEVDTVVFDKTGTLTSASPVLSDVVPLSPDYDRDSILRLAACLEEHFPHPVSRAVVRAATAEGLFHDDEPHDTEVHYIAAHGICSAVRGEKVVLGSRHFIEDDEGVDVTPADAAVAALADQGKSILYMAVGGRIAGVIGIEDPVREEARETIARLRERGIRKIVMLTGDGERTARHVAESLGLDDFRAQVLPEDKAKHVDALKLSGAKVLMVGDGINDSPALSAAHVGVTLRDGTDIAQEVADVVLTENRLSDLVTAIDLGKASMRRVKQNFTLSVGLNTAFLAGGLTGTLTPAAGALLHNATTIGVCLNAMRSPVEPLEPRRSLAHAIEDITSNVRSTVSDIEAKLAPTVAAAGAPVVART